MTNIWLIAKYDIEVTIFDKIVIENPSYEELHNAFKELYEKLKKLSIKYISLEKKDFSWTNEIDGIRKENTI